MIDIKKLNNLINGGDAKKLAHYLDNHNLKVENDKIVSNDKKYVGNQINYWDKRQLVKKINLNS